MKFTKQQAVEELTAKFKAKDKDLDLARTISEHVENALSLIGENEEMELSTFSGFVEKMLSSSVGLMRHEVSTAVRSKDDEINELKKKVKDEPAPKKEPDAQYTELLNRLKVLEDEKAEASKAKKISEVKQSLIDKIKEGGVKNEDWIKDALEKVSLSEDTNVETEADYYVKQYNKYFADVNPNVTPRGSKGGSTDGKNPVLDAVKALKKSQEFQPEKK